MVVVGGAEMVGVGLGRGSREAMGATKVDGEVRRETEGFLRGDLGGRIAVGSLEVLLVVEGEEEEGKTTEEVVAVLAWEEEGGRRWETEEILLAVGVVPFIFGGRLVGAA